MSSSKIRMQIRMKRLQQMYKALDKDPNAKELELKSAVLEFDKLCRKLIARIKKAKDQQLYSRQQILIRYGLKSSQRMTIDEEINSLIKSQEYELKRLRNNLASYREKMGDSLDDKEYNERNAILEKLKTCTDFFQRAYQEQTKAFENNAENKNSQQQIDLDDILIQVSNKLEFLERQGNSGEGAEEQKNFGLLQYVYMPEQTGGAENIYSRSAGSGGQADNEFGPTADEKLKQAKVRLQHSYFYATVINFKTLPHFAFDLLMLFSAAFFFYGALSQMVIKGHLENYHQKWQVNLTEFLG